MKKISKYLLLLAAAVFTFTACEKTVEREPSPLDVPGTVMFTSAGGTYELNMSKDPLETTVTLFRTSNIDKPDTILLKVEADPVFVIDPKVVFSPGDKQASIKVAFPTGEADQTYSFKLSIPEGKTSPYLAGQAVFEYTVKLVLWSEIRTGVWEDQTIGPAFNMAAIAWYVKYQVAEQPDGSTKVRILNPYACYATGQDADGIYDGFAYNDEGDVDESQDYNFILNVATSGEVRFTDIETFLGISWSSYTDMAFFDYAAYKGNPGTYGRFEKEKSKIVFDAQDNSMITELAGSLYGIQVNFQFYLSKAAYLADQSEPEPADATVETYEGDWTLSAKDASTGNPVDDRNVNIVSGEDEDGQFYTITGLHEHLPEVYGSFDEDTKAFLLGYNEGPEVAIGKKTYVPVLYPMDSSGKLKGSLNMKFVPGEAEGSVVLADDSEAIGFAIIYFNVEDESDYTVGEGFFELSFAKAEAAGAPAHKAAKRPARKAKTFRHTLKMAQ